KMIFKIHFQNHFQTTSKNRKKFCKNSSRTSARYLSCAINWQAILLCFLIIRPAGPTHINNHNNNEQVTRTAPAPCKAYANDPEVANSQVPLPVLQKSRRKRLGSRKFLFEGYW